MPTNATNATTFSSVTCSCVDIAHLQTMVKFKYFSDAAIAGR